MSAPSDPQEKPRRAVFLDRDGVVIEDVHLLTSPEQVRILEGVPEALGLLKENRFLSLVVTNQSVVARGWSSEARVKMVHEKIQALLRSVSCGIDDYYFCPHHPEADLAQYRKVCECRKPRPGMLHRAAAEHRINLHESFLVGDRLSDIGAGNAAGCRSILVADADSVDLGAVEPHERPIRCLPSLRAAVSFILEDLTG